MSWRAGPTFARLRARGHDPQRFRDREALPWLAFGGGLLVVLALLGMLRPDWGGLLERVSALAALWLFFVAVGAWFGMRGRAWIVASVLIIAVYPISAATRLFDVHDLFVINLLVGLLLFVLAGFNLVFVLEEVVYDIHRTLHFRSPLWGLAPALAVVALFIAVPLLEEATDLRLAAVRFTGALSIVVLAIAWIGRPFVGAWIVREGHLLVAGALAGGILADAVGLLRFTSGLLPAFIAYAAILGTWLYVSFTTLQRAQYFLRPTDVIPWAALLLSSSFAVLAHVHASFASSGALAIQDLLNVRVAYLITGVWIGFAFFLARGVWRIALHLRDEDRLSRRARSAAGRVARLSEEFLNADERVERLAYRMLDSVDRSIPGQPRAPVMPSRAPLDEHEGEPVRGRSRRRRRLR